MLVLPKVFPQMLPQRSQFLDLGTNTGEISSKKQLTLTSF